MAITRRRFIAGGSAATVAAVVAPRLQSEDLAGWAARPTLAWAAGRSAAMPVPTAAHHLLNRATWGVTLEEVERVRAMGLDSWIDEQLAPETIDDRSTEQAVAALKSVFWGPSEFKNRPEQRPVRNELIAATLYRAVKSRRQLFEVMVDHWSNHFNVYQPEEFLMSAKSLDDREVIRRHAMGSFRELLHASAASLAMMRYLNTFQNTRSGPNENYAREVMELHTVGVAVNGDPYTERDVKEVARCFTGWGMKDWLFQFTASNHDDGHKTVLGRRIQSSGVDEGHEVLDMLVDHPKCAEHVARRMVRRLVADEPPESLVSQVAAAFGRDGDIRAMLGVLLRSNELRQAYVAADGGPAKIKRPLELWVSLLRSLGVDVGKILDIPAEAYEDHGSVDYTSRAERYLQLMDHMPFHWLAPNGYPDTGGWWGGMHVMISRWNYGLAFAEGRLAGINPDLYGQMVGDGVPNSAPAVVDYWTRRILIRDPLPADRARMIDFLTRGLGSRVPPETLQARLPVLVALMFDSPYFQWR